MRLMSVLEPSCGAILPASRSYFLKTASALSFIVGPLFDIFIRFLYFFNDVGCQLLPAMLALRVKNLDMLPQTYPMGVILISYIFSCFGGAFSYNLAMWQARINSNRCMDSLCM